MSKNTLKRLKPFARRALAGLAVFPMAAAPDGDGRMGLGVLVLSYRND
jgi:hypothetical protein